MEKFPEQPRVITGVFCIFVEGGRGQDSLKWLGEIKERCKLLGLEFAYGERHSHQSINDIRLPLDARWQKYTIDKLKAYGGKKIALDMEPYYSGAQRYHRAEDREGLRNATSEWQSLGDVDLYIYPMGPEYVHGLALVENALKGDARVHGLDARTYNAANYDDLATYMANRAKLFKSKGMQYTPGFYLYFAKDPEVMKNAAQYDECWLFARTSPNHPDDLPHFGTPSWYPTSPQKKKSQ
ncbi:MAG TPA: hypothetical protein PKN33_11780 [Phycisphaerae bacterium]|nr:hypothetical protein [Phycisphaerae bacterium]